MTGPRPDPSLAALYAEYQATQRRAGVPTPSAMPDPPPATPAATPAPSLAELHAEYLAQKSAPTFGENARDFTRALLGQGVAAGFGDEIEGGARSLVDIARGEAPLSAYQRERDAIRTQDKAFAARNPKTAVGAEVLGGLAGMFVPVGEAARVASAGAKVARAAKVGAIYGGIAGLGKGEGDMASQAKSTAIGAAAGGVLGGALQAVGTPVAAAGRAVRQRLTESGEDRATRLIATALERRHVQLARNGQTLPAAADGMIAADVLGRPGQGLLDYAVSVPSAGGADAAELLANRASGRGTRLQQGVEEALGAKRGNVVAEDAAMRAARSAAAKSNYGAAYQEKVPVDLLTDVANIDGPNAFQHSYNIGRNLASVEGVKLPAWEQLIDGITAPSGANAVREMPVQALDYMKRGIDKLVSRGGDAEFAIDKGAARAMGNRMREILAAADPHAPAFARARLHFADDSELIDALDAGQSALREKPQAITDAVAALSDPAKRRFRQGIAEDVHANITGKDVLGTRSLRALQAPTKQDALAAAAADAPRALNLRRLIANEGTMQETEGTALRNSATARRLMQARDVEGAGVGDIAEGAKAAASAMAGNIAPAVRMIGHRAYSRYAMGVNEDVSDRLSQMLTAGRNDPGEVDDLLRLIVAFSQRQNVPRAARAAAGRVAGRTSGLLLGGGER